MLRLYVELNRRLRSLRRKAFDDHDAESWASGDVGIFIQSYAREDVSELSRLWPEGLDRRSRDS